MDDSQINQDQKTVASLEGSSIHQQNSMQAQNQSLLASSEIKNIPQEIETPGEKTEENDSKIIQKSGEEIPKGEQPSEKEEEVSDNDDDGDLIEEKSDDEQNQGSKKQEEVIEKEKQKDDDDDIIEDEDEEDTEDFAPEINRDQGKLSDSLLDESDDDSLVSISSQSSVKDVQIEDEDDQLVVNDYDDEMIEDQDEKERKQEKKQIMMNEKPISKLVLRDYQNILFKNSKNRNSIIYLPTGSGKTMVSIASMYYYLCREGQNKKIVFLANTIQLVKQQTESIKRNLAKIMENPDLAKSLRGDNDERTGSTVWTRDQIKNKVCCIHGQKNQEIGITKRKKIESELSAKKQILNMFKKGTIFVMIAQMFLNSLRRGYIKITDFSFIVLDQCHHCSGDHPYSGIMKQFYFDRPKKNNDISMYDNIEKLPIIMGLTASPVAQPFNNKDRLIQSLENLCRNLDSKFTFYETDKIRNETFIKIVEIKEDQEKDLYPDLLEHFQKFRDHKESYDKLKFHFEGYFKCVDEIVSFLEKEYPRQLSLESNPRSILSVELLLFYDIKECLLIKLRDIWLELGEYAFTLAYQQFLTQLHKINLKGERNKTNLNHIIDILKNYASIFNKEYGLCDKKFFSAKVNKLIEILQNGDTEVQSHIQSDHSNDMVLVFASKRRTVKYIEEILKKYKDIQPQQTKKDFDCRGVTGYSSKTFSNYYKNEMIYESDPSSERFYAEIQLKYNDHIKQIQDENRYLENKNRGESQNLTNEMKKMKNVKCGKLLLEVEEKYSHQINKITDFRNKKFRVLITTSVTEEGFDIPECNIVISFDKPNSLKSYIQIKGRARKQNSKYFIFTEQKNYKKMLADKESFDDTIKVTFDIALNKFSRRDQESKIQKIKEFEPDPGYRKSTIKETGAILNTNYSLEILKTYCASLRQPNKPMFYFIETPNIAFRCLVYFPPTSTTSKPYIVGDPQPSKVKALKSASYRAVIYLYKEGYIKTDLRPKKYEQLEDEREIERFEDIAETRKNQDYRMIFEEDVRIDIENVENQSYASKKFMRFYFKSILNSELDFPKINPAFKKHIPEFESKKFQFQIYMMKLSNKQNLRILHPEQGQQIGLLTCYNKEHTQQLFSEYRYNFQENQNEGFILQTAQESCKLSKAEYERLKQIHLFLVAAVQNRQHQYYYNQTGAAPVKPAWIGMVKKFKQEIYDNKKRQYYPLLVLLIKKGDQYVIDEVCNRKIEDHRRIFSQLYSYHNIPNKNETIHKFKTDLTENIREIKSELQKFEKNGNILVQSIEREFCFHKCLISQKIEYNDDMEKETNKNKKQTIKSRHTKLNKMFKHPEDKIREVVKVTLWRKFKKQKKAELFERDVNLMAKDIENPRLYLIDQFVLYPLTPSQLFKVSLAAQFLFKAYYEYTLAFAFKNLELTNIIKQKMKQASSEKPFVWHAYPSILLDNKNDIFKHLHSNGSSSYLRGIGKGYNEKSRFIQPEFQLSISKIKLDSSAISKNNKSLNQSGYSEMLGNISGLSNSSFMEDNQAVENIPIEIVDKNIVSELKITEILKVLTSRMYKFSKYDNYEEYQFIGDVVLKLLSTIEVFLDRPKAEESEMHLRRANIICNANLHRKAILKRIYKYILTKKYIDHPPPYEFVIKAEDTVEEFYENTKIKKLQKNNQLEGYHYIPGKVHADVIEALIGAFYLKNRSLDQCQILLYCFDILKKPSLQVHFDRVKYSESGLPQLYSDFEQRIDYKFTNKGLLLQAFTHSSFKSVLHSVIDKNNINNILEQANASLASQTSFLSNRSIDETTKVNSFETFYERLEFLGDAILDLIVVEHLYEKYGSQDEGLLTELKQAGVSNKTLGIIALKCGMHELILMEHPENDKVMKQFKQIQKSFKEIVSCPEKLIEMRINSIKILGDVFEALVGAIFLDVEMNYNSTKAIILNIIGEFLEHFTDLQNIRNSGSFKYQQYLEKNNYKNCHIKKDTSVDIENGMFKFILVDRMGNKVDECWEINEKRAYDAIYEKFYDKQQGKASNSILT